MDKISAEHRSWNMSRIRCKDTKPEKVVRSLLHCLGYRFRLHVSRLPGKPDIVLSKYKTVIFVHGCFWHRHHGCKYAYVPKSNRKFWQTKFSSNISRHDLVKRKLCNDGWKVYVIWECETKHLKKLEKKLRRILG